jgi:hypothetical protein
MYQNSIVVIRLISLGSKSNVTETKSEQETNNIEQTSFVVFGLETGRGTNKNKKAKSLKTQLAFVCLCWFWGELVAKGPD